MTDRQKPPAREQKIDTDSRLIALRGEIPRTRADLAHAAAAIRASLPAGTGGDWAVSFQSPFLLLAALHALQSVDARALLLPHKQPQLLERLTETCAGFIADEPLTVPGIVLPQLETLIAGGSERIELDHTWQADIGLLTSGSTGEPTIVFKTPAQFAAETDVLEATFGAEIEQDRVFCGTTSPQHLFGFTFRVMWPYLTGRPLADGQIRIPGEVGAAVRAHGRIVLISSPAFLSRAQSLFDYSELGDSRLISFSAGAPLDPAVSMRFNAEPGIRLIEIYGSTETGALAARISTESKPPPWQPLAGVRIEQEDGLLVAQGTHLPAPGRLKTEDQISMTGQGFHLRGRRDRIAKVADKRVSLTQLEKLLLEKEQVQEARVLQLAGGELGAVLVPSSMGWSQIAAAGKPSFCNELRDALCRSVERVTTPKRWRLVKRMPIDTQGKLVQTRLISLFEPSVDHPIWKEVDYDQKHWRGVARISSTLAVFDGHFPGHPIVPGVAQVHWAAEKAREVFDLPTLQGSLKSVKFTNPIRPEVNLQLTLALNSDGSVAFEYRSADRAYSSGRIVTASN